jgi:hypothetical protein
MRSTEEKLNYTIDAGRQYIVGDFLFELVETIRPVVMLSIWAISLNFRTLDKV